CGHVRELLDSPNNALVVVSALIPAGARRGDRIDVEVHLPQQSKVTSLRGGYLQECVLRNYSSTKTLNPDFKGIDTLKEGHILARGRGPLVVGLGDGDEAARVRSGRVWEGGVSLLDRPF